ncbi:hypothetical protein TMatcc_007647 [Talaromyces marneffei ATCC 18224]
MREMREGVFGKPKETRKSGQRHSYLSLDVDNSIRLGFGVFEHSTCFAGQEPNMSVPLLQQLPRSMFKNKTGTLLIRLKAKFFGDESNLYVRPTHSSVRGRQTCP